MDRSLHKVENQGNILEERFRYMVQDFVMAITFSRHLLVTTTDSFSYFLVLLLISFLFLLSSSWTKVYFTIFTSNRALGLLKEGLADRTRQSARRRRTTPRILFKPLKRLLLSSMTLPSLNRLLFLRRRQDRITNSQSRRNGWRLQPRSKGSWNVEGRLGNSPGHGSQ